MVEALQRFGDDFRTRYTGAPLPENPPEDHEHLFEGWRKAGVLG